MSRDEQKSPCQGYDTGCSPPIPASTPPSSTSPPTTSFDATSTSSSTPTSTLPSVIAVSSSASTSLRPNTLAVSSKSNAGTIAGCVIGGVIFLVLVALCTLLYLRARKRERTPPSSEFMNTIRAGAMPVLRLDSGAEYIPALSEKVAGCTHYPPSPPPPLYHPNPNTKLPDEAMFDPPSGRPSIEKPLHPQRYSSQRQGSDAFVVQHHPSTSVGSRRELWGSDVEVGSIELSPVRRSPAHTESALQFAPRFSLDDIDTSPQPLLPSRSPPPLHPLRRQPDSDD